MQHVQNKPSTLCTKDVPCNLRAYSMVHAQEWPAGSPGRIAWTGLEDRAVANGRGIAGGSCGREMDLFAAVARPDVKLCTLASNALTVSWAVAC